MAPTPKKVSASPQTPTRASRRLRGDAPELNISNPLESPSKSAKKKASRARKRSQEDEKIPKHHSERALDFTETPSRPKKLRRHSNEKGIEEPDDLKPKSSSSGTTSVGVKKSPHIIPSSSKKSPRPPKHTVDDKFFSLDEMGKFLDDQERKNQSTNMLNEFDEDVGGAEYRYADFFGSGSDNEDENEGGEEGDNEEEDQELEEELKNIKPFDDNNAGDSSGQENEDAGFEDDEDIQPSDIQPIARREPVTFNIEDDSETDESDLEDEKDIERPSAVSNKLLKKVSFVDTRDEDEDVQDEDEDVQDEELEDEKMEVIDQDEPETEFGKEKKKMRAAISEFEQQNLQPRSWELSGEVAANQRGQDELLNHFIEVDYRATLPPVISEDVNARIESIVKRRIKDQNFDDVIRTKRVDESLQTYRARTNLDDIDRKSLMQMYEDEYRRKAENTTENTVEKVNGGVEEEEKLDPESESIQSEMNSIFSRLDTLFHSHYRPTEVQGEPEVIVNKLAVNLEEVGQRAVTAPDEELLAPEEIAKHVKFAPKSKEERTKTDKLRERRKKKKRQKIIVRILKKKKRNVVDQNGSNTKCQNGSVEQADGEKKRAIKKSRNRF